jgi:hypothetical protein
VFAANAAEHAGDDFLANEGDPLNAHVRDHAERLVLFYNRRGLNGNPNVLRWLLGREPTTIDQWIEIQLEQAGLA